MEEDYEGENMKKGTNLTEIQTWDIPLEQ